MTDEEVARLLLNAEHYVNNYKRYQRDFKEQDALWQESSCTNSSWDPG